MKMSRTLRSAFLRQGEFELVRAFDDDFRIVIHLQPPNGGKSADRNTRRHLDCEEAIGIMLVARENDGFESRSHDRPARHAPGLLGAAIGFADEGTARTDACRSDFARKDGVNGNESTLGFKPDAEFSFEFVRAADLSVRKPSDLRGRDERFQTKSVGRDETNDFGTDFEPSAVRSRQRLDYAIRRRTHADDAVRFLRTRQERRTRGGFDGELVFERGIGRIEFTINRETLFEKSKLIRRSDEIGRGDGKENISLRDLVEGLHAESKTSRNRSDDRTTRFGREFVASREYAQSRETTAFRTRKTKSERGAYALAHFYRRHLRMFVIVRMRMLMMLVIMVIVFVLMLMSVFVIVFMLVIMMFVLMLVSVIVVAFRTSEDGEERGKKKYSQRLHIVHLTE